MSDAPTHKPGDIVNGHRLETQPDGTLAWVPLPTPTPAPGPTPASQPTKTKWYTKKKILIPLIAVAAIVVIGAIGASNGKKTPVDADKPAAAATSAPTPKTVTVPDVTGLTAESATPILEGAGLKYAFNDDDPSDTVISTNPVAGTDAHEGDLVTVTVKVKPKLTLSQQNAVDKAQSYLETLPFSRIGLIKQLEFEGYSAADATFGTDHADADWNEQAGKKAQSYLDTMSFSRSGLYKQLLFEGFTAAQANAGLKAVGY